MSTQHLKAHMALLVMNNAYKDAHVGCLNTAIQQQGLETAAAA